MERGDVLERGWQWADHEPEPSKVDKTILVDQIPDLITDVPADIVNWAINCEITGKPFKVIPQELKFYRKMNLPIPHRHPNQRHLERQNTLNPYHLFDRKCDKCGVDIKTTFSPERPEKVYCEKCYLGEVY